MQLVSLDYALLTAYLILMVFIGSAFGWLVKDAASYLKGGNTIPWYIAGTSNFMSMFSTFIFIAYAGIAYEHGLVAVTVLWSAAASTVFAAKFLAVRWRRADLTTPVEFLERRFGFNTRQVFSWMGLLMRFLDNAVRLYASGVFLSAVTPVDLSQAIVISGVVITIFTMIGGLWAVVVMDTVQFIVLLIASLILVPLSMNAAGGFAGIQEAVPNHLEWFNGPKGSLNWLLVYYLLVMLKYNGNWAFIQRLYAVRDERESKRGAWCSAAFFFLMPPIFLLPAIAARVIVPDLENPEQAYVAVCAVLLPAGMLGLMLASMFSATVSSLNSEFNVMAGVLTNDIFHRFIRPAASDPELLLVARAATVVVGLLITFAALYVGGLGGAFEASKIFATVLAIPLGLPLLLGLLTRRPTARSAMLTVFGGAFFSFIMVQLEAHGSELVPAALRPYLWEIGTVLTFLVCLALLFLTGRKRSLEKENEVATFMTQLETPVPAEKVPVIDPSFKIALGRLFSLSFAVSGAFFLIVGVLTFGSLAGKWCLAAGLLCALGGLLLWPRRAATHSSAVS